MALSRPRAVGHAPAPGRQMPPRPSLAVGAPSPPLAEHAADARSPARCAQRFPVRSRPTAGSGSARRAGAAGAQTRSAQAPRSACRARYPARARISTGAPPRSLPDRAGPNRCGAQARPARPPMCVHPQPQHGIGCKASATRGTCCAQRCCMGDSCRCRGGSHSSITGPVRACHGLAATARGQHLTTALAATTAQSAPLSPSAQSESIRQPQGPRGSAKPGFTLRQVTPGLPAPCAQRDVAHFLGA